MKILIIIIICSATLIANGFPIPKDNKASFDVIRKNKIIGSVETIFEKENSDLIIETIVDIEIKILFIPAYKFYQKSKEIWSNNEFIFFDGYTDFEDDREYFIKGRDIKNNFIATGMDGKLILDKKILPLNYWNKSILKEKEVFDIQKGIVRKITVKKLADEVLQIGKYNILAEKYLLNATNNPKDIGPFPEYTIWYDKNNELVKFKFINWKDNKEIITQRNNWSE